MRSEAQCMLLIKNSAGAYDFSNKLQKLEDIPKYFLTIRYYINKFKRLFEINEH